MTKQGKTFADVVLRLFPVDQPQKWHMAQVNNNVKVTNIVNNPVETDLNYTWIIAVWTQTFTHFMHGYLARLQKTNAQIQIGNDKSVQKELYISNVLQAAIVNKLKVEGVIFPSGSCLDIGTTSDLFKAMQNHIV